MKTLWSMIACSVVALVVGLCGPAQSEDVVIDADIAEAIARTTTLADGGVRASVPNPRQQVELARALAGMHNNAGSLGKNGRGTRCYYNCPPPVGSVTAAPQVLSLQAGRLGSVTIHWRWDQSLTQTVSQHSCLWVSGSDESEAHLVQCERPGHTYATSVGWIGEGSYIFRVAPGNPKGPFTKPVVGLFQLAQTIVIGAPR
jgi:hypothetical protein